MTGALRIKKSFPAQVLLFLSLLGAVGFGDYHPPLHVREFSGLCAVALFLWLVSTTRIRRSGRMPLLVPVLSPLGVAVLFACVFYIRTGYSPLPSVLAQRDFAFFLIAPSLYLLHMRGWGLIHLRNVFFLAAMVTVAYYAASYFTVDAQSWLNSGDPDLASRVVYDESRGYRLKGPLFIMLFLALYCGARSLQAVRTTLKSALYLSLAFASAALLLVNLPRALMVSAVAAFFIYFAFLRRPAHVGLLAGLFPALACVGALLARPLDNAINTSFGTDWSYLARMDTSKRAWDYFLEYPLLGFGQDSKRTVSFQDLFGVQFFPQDVGLLGVAFKFGLVGTVLYLIIATWLVVSLLRVVWNPDGGWAPRERTFVWALFVTCLTIIVATPLQASFIYSEGIPIAAVVWGILLARKHGLPRPAATPGVSEPESAGSKVAVGARS
jgi:O-Antigen ligase